MDWAIAVHRLGARYGVPCDVRCIIMRWMRITQHERCQQLQLKQFIAAVTGNTIQEFFELVHHHLQTCMCQKGKRPWIIGESMRK